MKNYLYILHFKDGEHFKIGSSRNHFHMVYSHDKTYDIDFSKSFAYSASEATVRSIETILLGITSKIETFNGLDGATEVRTIKELESCMKVLEDFENKGLIEKKKIPKRPSNYKPRILNEPNKTKSLSADPKEMKEFTDNNGRKNEDVIRDFINYLLLDKEKVLTLYGTLSVGINQAVLNARLDRMTSDLSDTEILDNLIEDINLFTVVDSENLKDSFKVRRDERKREAEIKFKKLAKLDIDGVKEPVRF